MKIIGYADSMFTAADGTVVEGMNIYCTESRKNVIGSACERIYISAAKLNDAGYIPSIDDEIEVLYNKYGKVASIRPL